MNPVDIKNKIQQNNFKILERIDDRIIIYENNEPIGSFKNIKELVIKLREREKTIFKKLKKEKARYTCPNCDSGAFIYIADLKEIKENKNLSLLPSDIANEKRVKCVRCGTIYTYKKKRGKSK